MIIDLNKRRIHVMHYDVAKNECIENFLVLIR